LINKLVFSLRILVRGDFASNLSAILAEQGVIIRRKKKSRGSPVQPILLRQMRIYPDSKDLINIIEKSDPCSADYLESFLRTGGHQIVLSLMTVVKISGPLLHKEARTNLMRLLNRIESMPHAFIHSSSIPRLELKEALKAFSNGREYHKINPYLDRFDEIVDFHAQPPTKIYSNTRCQKSYGISIVLER